MWSEWVPQDPCDEQCGAGLQLRTRQCDFVCDSVVVSTCTAFDGSCQCDGDIADTRCCVEGDGCGMHK